MRDFTLNAYTQYLKAIKKSYQPILRFDEYFRLHPKPESFCLIRHDVDRKPFNALEMARLEASMAVKATYCFRTKRHTLKSDIISAISSLGHEIAYHYESLSDTKGNMGKAIKDFEKNLAKLRKFAPVSTIAMHGRPLSAFDNKAIWQTDENHDKLTRQYSILGEMYLDIDYANIAYISDTGRNWTSQKANRRDHVNSEITLDFSNGQSLLTYLNNQPHPKLVFQIHPERWSNKSLAYLAQYTIDKFANLVKAVV